MPKITALPASAGLALADLLAVVDDPGGVPATQQATLTQLKTLLDTIYAPITGGAYVLKAGDTMTGLLTIAQATANTSNLILSGQSLTGANAQSLIDLAGTWNTSGNPSAIRLTITNTASGATAKLFELLVGATSMFSVAKDGQINLAAGSGLISSSGTFMPLGAGGGAAYAASGTFFRDTVGIRWSQDAAWSGTADTGLFRNAAGILEVNSGTAGGIGALRLNAAGRLIIASGANQRAGNLTLIGGTLTVANTTVTANSIILLTRKATGGTIGFAVTYTVIAATSFTVTSDNVLDTSTYSYLIIEVP